MDELKNEIESLRTQLSQFETANRPGQPTTSEHYQSQLLDSVQESVIGTNLDGEVTYWGRGAQELYGYTPEEVLGKPVTFIVEPEEERVERERMRQVFEHGSWKGVYQQRRKDGSRFWASTIISLVTDKSGNPTGFIGIDIDITDQKRANEELDQLNLAIENAMQGISRLDREGCFIMVKPQYAEMLGYQPDELLGQSWTVTVPEDSEPLAREGYETMLREGRATLECRARRKDGSVFFKQLLLVKAFDARGEHDGHYCFMSDVTKRKQAEIQLREKEAQLAHVSRLSTMGELVAGIAHEVNQPLYAIANFAAVAEKKLENRPDELGRTLQELNRLIAEQAVRAGEIIRRLRAFVGKTDGVRSTLDMNAVIRDAVAILTPMTHGADASVRLELSPSPVVVHADRVQLEQVVVNLVRNGLEAVAGREVRMITVRTALVESMVQVSVEDTGIGVPEPEQNKLFDAFFTSKQDGLGMGLSISRTIVENHDGRIWATPRRQGGLVVHFTLPHSPGGSEAQTECDAGRSLSTEASSANNSANRLPS
ncbi:PAS domain S-box protein [Stieleria sp. ICT_E10.1]|uniref:PAS domain-containing sensor histidine kinase n=1 Tax=Stieleria sedimenti TaxID=2976331 RepID=UPI00217F58F9|nr:PAS domain S-box protein [Stieleria sedimenti]MCS7466818.1 PAS domain S-box protein [Stieleria sedimenti]